jgi:hypothetical protein
MNGIGKQAAFYRGYLPGDRSLVPLTVLVSTTVALWLLVYLICVAAGDAPQYAASFEARPLSAMLGLPGTRRVASTADGSPANTETTE